MENIGEHSSVAEELLLDVPALNLKYIAIERSILEGYFSLKEALGNYGVSETECIAYSFLKDKAWS